jgi:hypothetical protein
MKEASGELNITLITIIAIAAIATLFVFVIRPRLQNAINNGMNSAEKEANKGKIGK